MGETVRVREKYLNKFSIKNQFFFDKSHILTSPKIAQEH